MICFYFLYFDFDFVMMNLFWSVWFYLIKMDEDEIFIFFFDKIFSFLIVLFFVIFYFMYYFFFVVKVSE